MSSFTLTTKIDQSAQITARLFSPRNLPWMVIGLGVIIRLVHFLANRSLWVDEASLALEIVNKSYSQLSQPLDAATGAPLAFLFIERLAIDVLTNTEQVLRLYPFIAGIATLFLFYAVAKYYLRPTAVLIGLLLLAVSPSLIRYSVELKQYSSDATVALVILLLVTYAVRKNLSVSWLAVLAIGGAVSVWFSHPAVFVLAGVGSALAISHLVKRDWLKVFQLCIVFAIWIVSFGISFQLAAVDSLVANKGIAANFSQTSRFMPLPPNSIADVQWFVTTFFEVFDNPLGISLSGVGAIALIIGSITLWREDRYKYLILILPIAFVLAASGLKMYPFAARWLLFAVPSLLILIAAGTFQIIDKTKATYPAIGIVALVLLFLTPALSTGRGLISPAANEELKPVMSYVRANEIEGDTVYVYYGARPAFRYYAEQLGFSENSYTLGLWARDNPEKYYTDLDALKGNARVWIVFSHVYKSGGVNEESFILDHLDEMGERLDSFKKPGSKVYLYDLS